MACPICWDSKDLRSLPCGHKVHLDCLKFTFERGVKELSEELIKCQDCKKDIEGNFIIENLGSEYFVMKCDIQFAFSMKTNQSNLKCFLCPNVACKNIFNYDPLQPPEQFQTCQNCKTAFCIKCLSPAHKDCPDCEEYQKILLGQSTQDFCPKCKSIYVKIENTCNRISCTIENCRCIFCHLCKKTFESVSLCYDHFNNSKDPCFGKLRHIK